ncbi:MAG TPA: riboflavin synthase [Minicystis sp.]|nr:riboflavin synthase [Minicystis sp.]
MFTGLVEALGVLRGRRGSPVARATIEADLGALELGESINVMGACLTVDRITDDGFEADLSIETRAKTTLDTLPAGAKVHLERATPAGGRLGGHVVLGHVDGLAEVTAREPSGEALRLEVRAPAELARYVAPKGSIALDGVSLTVNHVARPTTAGVVFDVMLVPHTLRRTLLGELRPGARVNVEADVLARYVAHQLSLESDSPGGDPEGSDERMLDKLRAGGFL